MKNYLYIFIVSILFSCGQISNKEINYDYPIENPKTSITKEEILDNPKATHYLGLMKSKNYSISMNAPCGDALGDKTTKRRECITLKEDISKHDAIIHFKFKAACCQEFMGDYSINNNVLTFTLEQVNDVACSCICWYHYELKINELDFEIKKTKFDFINR
jgi:hypothetical protein